MANSLKINPWRSKYGHAEMIFSLNTVGLENLILKILCFFFQCPIYKTTTFAANYYKTTTFAAKPFTRCRFNVGFEFVFFSYLNFTLITVDNTYHSQNVSFANRNETVTVTCSHSAG